MTNGTAPASNRRSLFPYALFGSASIVLAGVCIAATLMLSERSRARPQTAVAEVEEASSSAAAEIARPTVRMPRTDPRAAAVQTQPAGALPTGPGQGMSREESARRRGEVAVQDLERSGPGRPSEMASAMQSIEGWKATAPFGSNAEFGAIRCFERGCTVTVTRPRADLLADTPGTDQRNRLRFWNGGVFRAGDLPAGADKVQNTWIFYQPPKENN